MKTLPVVKCTVSTDEQEVDVSRWIDEYDMLETLLYRDKTSGTLVTVTFPVNFVSYAKDYVKGLFEKHGLYAKARFNVYLREDYGVNYNLVKSTALDFSTYKEEAERVTIECAEEELTQLINSEGKTKYEILVDKDIKSDKQWHYQRMMMYGKGVYEIAEKTVSDIGNNIVFLSLSLTKSEVVTGSEHDIKAQNYSKGPDFSYFFKSFKKELVSIDISFEISGVVSGDAQTVYVSIGRSDNGIGWYDNSLGLHPLVDGRFSGIVRYKWEKYVSEGEMLGLYLSCPHSAKFSSYTITKFERFNLLVQSTSSPNFKIDIIDPIKLMQKYLDKMSGSNGYFTVKIDWGEKDKDYKTMLVAAESIRQIPNAKIYGSPKDFFEWMKVLGYEYECIDRKLIFKPRDEFFKKNVSAMGLRAHELADLVVQADQTYAYTSVEIGYDKQDYENTNGRCEANGTFCYTTGFIARKDNKLSLISPYRADSMGIEFLCQETSKDSTDTKSDKDVFFVALNDSGNYYTEYKGIEIVDKELGIKMFNAPFNPYFLIQRNESLIGINANQVKFKSTDMSGTAKLSNGTNIYQDQQITKKLFEPIEYNFAAGHWQKIPVPEKRNGLIYFEWQGKMLKGFIKEIRKNYACETETSWILWAVR